jgi:hypothetical protein
MEREKNYGIDYKIIEGIKMMAARFPQFIVVKDDLVVKKNIFFKQSTKSILKSGRCDKC